MSNKKNIIKNLSEIKDTWQKEGKDLTKNFISLKNFLNNIHKKNPNISLNKNLNPGELPYNTSLFHFFIYYTYNPKHPFVLSKNDTLIFGSFYKRNYDRIEISFPLFRNVKSAIKDFNNLIKDPNFSSILEKNKIKKILLRDIDDNFVNFLRKNKGEYNFKIDSLKEINYSVYNLEKTLNLDGKNFSNLKWHLNRFNKNKHRIELVDLSDNIKEIIHLIGKWKRISIKDRDFSYINLKSDKLGARFFGNIKHDKKFLENSDVIFRVLKIDGRVSSFNLGFPLGIFEKQNVFAHSIGIADISVPHLSEYAQYDFWQLVKNKGYNFVNDGPSWKNSLEIYKDKFRPIYKKRYYWADINICH